MGDAIGQHGPDGLLDVDLAFDPFVPEGRSFWEIGTGLNAGAKATSDYGDLLKAIPESTRLESTFVFVTPLSGRRDWEHTWKEDAQGAWLEVRRAKNEWREVRVIDGTKLIDWIHQYPPVELWLAQRTICLPVHQLDTPEQRWNLVRTIGEPPPLTPKLFLTCRDDVCAKLDEVVAGTAVQLKLETHFPDQVVDFVSAYLANLDAENHADAAGRCLVVSGADAWNAICSQKERFILIADSTLDLSGEIGTKLIQKARRNGHAVIFGGPAGGIPDPTSVSLRPPRSHDVREALEQAGYGEERARTLAQKSGGHLGSLLRCLQNLSLMPEWAEGSVASELAIAALLGAWTDDSDADRAVVEDLSGNSYGEWIGKMREVALRPGTPLTQRAGKWRFAARYEGWYALGPKLFDDHLVRLRNVAAYVLTEKDPQFELPKEERYAARIQGKVLTHSWRLRSGLAGSLALLGSHPKALSSCTHGRAELTAVLAVRDILADADWERWASLGDLLPLLAEASPEEFLSAMEKALATRPCPFDLVFAEESDGVTGRTYMSGVLWALETLAWDPSHLYRVVICLGELAERDPGGNWSNRPANSLSTILLPWLPQTCAPVDKRAAAISGLLTEVPEIGWNLLVSLLPQSKSTSPGTSRPAWRQTIPEDWSKAVTRREYWEQVELYSNMMIETARLDRKKLEILIDHIESLPPLPRECLLDHLSSDAVIRMPESDRMRLWNALVDVVTKHKKFSGAEWAMGPDQVDRITSVAERMSPDAPAFRHQRLFGERDSELYKEKGNYDEQHNELELSRQRAVEEVAMGGVQAVLEFAETVQSPWRVGIAYGVVAGPDMNSVILPDLVESEQKQLCQFAGGFVISRFRIGGWQWVDGIDTTRWSSSQIGQFLSFLPFAQGAWERSARLLGSDEVSYWSKTSAIPYQTDTGLEHAIDELVRYGRPIAALRCLHKMLLDKQPLDGERTVRALLAALESTERMHSLDAYETAELIKALQQDPTTQPEDLFRVEWAYLPLLGRHNDCAPRLLERRLATTPAFFCEVIRLVFRSKIEERLSEDMTEERKGIAGNAYRLLNEWQTPPGLQVDGTFDGAALGRWLDAVKEECAETGHIEIAMTMIGHSLIHVPSDPDGLWIHHSAAAALNARDAEDMRNGFRTELYNSRGVYWVDPTGAPERELATKYRAQAEAVENAGYHRLATTLRELAATYERDADGAASRDRIDE
ncbi:hypothetical protein [Synechococcus sp. BO 8801]|uniref:hypothetical protein n=1 Tax=Synechococcus sp. BO 8801 TaxID=169670 RepID=UPI0018E9DF05|nr:hypothetical protein [Synechococcus sp. BO 8801]